MKRFVYLILLFPLLYACQDAVPGELIGVRKRKTFYTDALGPGGKPYGMVYIPSQGYQSGGQDDDEIMGLHTSRTKTVSIQAMYMDATEISNNEYRQFVHWVRDSIAREKLYARSYGKDAEDWISIPDPFFKEPYRTFMEMGSDVQGGNTPFQLFNDSTNNTEVDKTIMKLLGSDHNNNTKINPNPLVNGYEVDKQNSGALDFSLSSDPKMAKERLKGTIRSLTMSNDELKIIFANYTALNDGSYDPSYNDYENTGGNPKNAPDPSGGFVPGGRVENRKYFTLNWDTEIDYSDPVTQFMLSDMFYSRQERFNNRKEIDTRLLFYDYYWIDYQEAAKRGRLVGSNDGVDQNYRHKYLGSDQSAVPDLFDNDNYLNKSRRDPLGKDYKTESMHRVVVDPSSNTIALDTTIYTKQWANDPKDANTPFQNGGKGYNIDRDAASNTVQKVLKNPGQDLDLGYTNSKGQHNALRGHTDRSRFIIKEKINVYPDTLCWVRDFTYSLHEHMTQNYFWHTAYDNYPVVGVTWTQAKAFSVWRTQIYHTWLREQEELYVNDFRLPTESEWEGAARGELDLSAYPWGGPYIRNSSGCFLANFKPMRGRYFEDGGFHTVKVYSYQPNAYGLYCMAGNVAEWCVTTFDESQYEFGHDLNSNYDYQALDWDSPVKKRKVIRGGSWKDIGYYIQNGTRTYEYQDSAKSYIGFRNVMNHLGRGGKELEKETGEDIQSDIQLK